MGNDLKGRQSATLDVFSGTVTLAQPYDLPEGASPRTQNVDFSVGSVFTRQGLENPFTYQGGSAGPNGGGSAVDTSLGGAVWSNPGNVLLNTSVYATTTLSPTYGVGSVTITNGGLYTSLALIGVNFSGPGAGGATGQAITIPVAGGKTVTGVQILTPGSYTGPVTVTFSASSQGIATGTVNLNTIDGFSDAIDVEQFGFSVASGHSPQGFVVDVKGYSSAAATLNVQMLKAGSPVGNIESIAMNVGGVTTLSLGGINDLFGMSWLYSDLNNTAFGVRIAATSSVGATVYVGYVTLTPYFVPSQENYNYIATYEDAFGNIYNVALDAAGDFWIEYVSTNPGVLVPLFTGPPSGSFGSSFTANSRQYVAISDLLQGTYPPQQIVGTSAAQTGWNDRVSQVGPGASPAFQGTLTVGGIVSITAYSASGSILTLTAANTLTAGEVVSISATGSDPLLALNGLSFNVLGTGLSSTAFEISTSLIAGSGTSTATAIPQYTYPIVALPNGITQYPFWNVAQGYQTQLDDILWSDGPGSTNSGNVITVYYLQGSHGLPDANLVTLIQQQLFPVYVYVSGTNLPQANGTHLVTSIGAGFPPGAAATRYYFTFNVAESRYQNLGGGANSQPGQYQLTVAMVNAALSLPGVQTGDDITISGAGVAGWNETWPVVNALNSGSYSISQTSMAAGVATYDWALSGATANPPVSGQLVTVTGTLNGNGIFNVTDAVVGTVVGTSSGTFTISGFANLTYSTQVEVGQATTSGTQFQIDPGPLALGNSATDPIYGNSGGGYITLVGSSSVVVGTGTRKGTCFFITRNGYWTRCAAPVQFTVTANTNYILVSNIPVGPPEVVARAIVFTEAGQNGQAGASYYVIPVPVSFVYNTQTYLSSSTIINDNTTTNAKFTFPDDVLLNAEEVDIQGNNLFNLGELGDAAWCAQYAGRAVYGRVKNKIQNFVNLTFDGGYNPNPGGPFAPLGWGLDSANNNPASMPTLLVSPVYGNSFYIQNQTLTTQSALGMIVQTAYQDWNNVAILQNQTPYSVRVTVRTPSSATSGSLVIDLTSFNAGSGWGKTYGSYSLPLSSMTSNMVTYTGTLLTTNTLNIPSDLYLRVWASGLTAGGDIDIDRIEIFPTLAPTNFTQLSISYKNDLDSFDLVTGGTDTTTVNAQPANGGFEMNSLFYIVKESSLGYISETPNQEPSNWNPYKEVSNVAGACGINAFDVGKKWAIMGAQNGLFLFNGGEPIPVQLEIPDIWQAINWEYGYTMCIRNDTANNRILVAAPLATPNQWCPDFPANANPTSPNVVMAINYEGIGTVEELMAAMPMRVTLMGKLSVHDLKRKTSLWSIPTPYIGYCKRNELFSEMLFCNGIGSSKIYALGSYQAGADDGIAFPSSYCTYPFVSPDKAETLPVFGMHNKRYVYYDMLIYGSGDINAGTLSVKFYQNTLNAPYPFVVPGGITLADPAANDIEGPLDELGQRMFVEVKTNGVGSYFNLSRVTLVAQADAHNAIRGF